jgi:hypothetical protein
MTGLLFFVAHVRKLAAEAGVGGRSVVPAHVWEQAVATFDWATYEGRRLKSLCV